MARRTLWRRFRRATRGPRNALLARLIWGSGRLLGALPVPVALAVGRTLGRGAHRLLGAARRLALAHVAFAFPELDAAERARVVGETFRHAGQSFAELTLFPRLRARPGYISFEGVERLDRALAAGRGAIVVTGHVGNWELLAAACSARGLPITVVGRRVNDMRFHSLVTRFRQAAGLEVLVRDDPRFVSAVREALARNRIVAMLIDQDTRGAGVFVPFFGRLARTPPGPAVLALRARVPVLTVFIHRRLDGSHRIRFDDVPVGGRRTRAEVTELTARLTAAIEGAIREAPPQWVWWHERWRRRPEAADLPGMVTGDAAAAIDASA